VRCPFPPFTSQNPLWRRPYSSVHLTTHTRPARHTLLRQADASRISVGWPPSSPVKPLTHFSTYFQLHRSNWATIHASHALHPAFFLLRAARKGYCAHFAHQPRGSSCLGQRGQRTQRGLPMSPQCSRTPGLAALRLSSVTAVSGTPRLTCAWRPVLRCQRCTPLRTHQPHLRRIFLTSSTSAGTSSSTSYLNNPNPRISLPSSTPHPRPIRYRNCVLVMATSTQVRQRTSHSHHHHHHHHDNVYLTSSNKDDAGVRITRIGLFSNLGMAVAKGAGGYMFNSQSMIADAWHSLTDLASDVLTLATVSWSLKPPTDKFPTGFGKIESLGSLGVSGMLLGGGLFMCWSSLQIIYAHFFLDGAAAAEMIAHAQHHGHSHGHDHSHGAAGAAGAPSIHAAWLALGTVLVKEWLYHASKFLLPLPKKEKKKHIGSWMTPNKPYSYESCPRTQVFCSRIERSASQSR
jgi:ABC-type nickel/cobalt efflux system permease component RcnA